MAAAAEGAVAVIGLACRFPGAGDAETFWARLVAGEDCVSDLAPGTAGDRVMRWGVLDGAESFDAGFFGFTPREAQATDPQQRVLLEVAASALDDAGYGAAEARPLAGAFVAVGVSGYRAMVEAAPGLPESVGATLVEIGNAPEHVAGRVAHLLDLRGPVKTVQTACSSSLVAVHEACMALLAYECDLALAGGVAIKLPQDVGYPREPGGIGSPDGRTRSFDAAANGTVGGNGAGAVVLRRLTDALRDGDPIRAVILGSAVNNDGARRAGYAAPSAEGQAEVMAAALAVADVAPESVAYVECHGSGTPLGDAIELAAVQRAYDGGRAGRLMVGSVKSNIGHLREAAGIAGLIKAVLSLEAGVVAPTLHFESWSPLADVDGTRLAAPVRATRWPDAGPRRAAVSSFGLGGTNAHVVLEAGPIGQARAPDFSEHLLMLSARTDAALENMAHALADRLERGPPRRLADVARTLRDGRRAHERRLAVVAGGPAAAAAALRRARRPTSTVRSQPKVAFLLAGTGDGYEGLASGLYRSEPAFKEIMDAGLAATRPWLDRDLAGALRLDAGRPAAAASDFGALVRAARGEGACKVEPLTLPEQHATDFLIAYALAQFWRKLGAEPVVLTGYSLGEYAAATVAGVFDLCDALRIVIGRAGLIECCAEGAMLSVCLSGEAARPLLPEGVSIAAQNGPGFCVVAGAVSGVEAAQRRFAGEGVAVRRLPVRRAVHTQAMAGAADELAALVGGVRRSAPAIPLISNVSGEPLSAADATDPAYWARHLCEPVQFEPGLRRLLASGARLLIEAGPGQALGGAARQIAAREAVTVVASLPAVHDPRTDRATFLQALGLCWSAGLTPRRDALAQDDAARKVALPGYAFERQVYTVKSLAASEALAAGPSPKLVRRRSSPLETAVAALFGDMIGCGPVPPDASFFEIGGNSLLGLQLLLRLKATFGLDLDMATLYREPTARAIAAHV